MLLKKQSQVYGSLELLPSLTWSDPLAIKYDQQYNKSADYSEIVSYTKTLSSYYLGQLLFLVILILTLS